MALITEAKANKKALVVTDLPEDCHATQDLQQLSFKVRTTDDDDDEERVVRTYCFGSGQDPRIVLMPYYELRLSNPRLLAALVFALYSQQIVFTGSAKGAVAFLHDHIGLHRVIQRIRFFYRLEGAMVTYKNLPHPVFIPKTCITEYRRFTNIAIHQMSGLRSYSLRIGAEFWDIVDWHHDPAQSMSVNATRVYYEEDLGQDFVYTEERSRYDNFLQWHARMVLEVFGRVSIVGADDDTLKKEFVECLNKKVDERRLKRTDVVRVRNCCCGIAGRSIKDGTTENCCVWELPRSEQYAGVPASEKYLAKKARTRQEQADAKKKNDEEKEKVAKAAKVLRKSNVHPADAIALDFLDFMAWLATIRFERIRFLNLYF